MNKLLEERVIEDGITDIDLLSHKFHSVINKFKKVNKKGMIKKQNYNYYVEVSEVQNTETKRVAFATILPYSIFFKHNKNP